MSPFPDAKLGQFMMVMTCVILNSEQHFVVTSLVAAQEIDDDGADAASGPPRRNTAESQADPSARPSAPQLRPNPPARPKPAVESAAPDSTNPAKVDAGTPITHGYDIP